MCLILNYAGLGSTCAKCTVRFASTSTSWASRPTRALSSWTCRRRRRTTRAGWVLPVAERRRDNRSNVIGTTWTTWRLSLRACRGCCSCADLVSKWSRRSLVYDPSSHCLQNVHLTAFHISLGASQRSFSFYGASFDVWVGALSACFYFLVFLRSTNRIVQSNLHDDAFGLNSTSAKIWLTIKSIIVLIFYYYCKP